MIAKTVIGNHMKIEPIRTNLSNDLRRGTNKLAMYCEIRMITKEEPFQDLFGLFGIERLREDIERLESRQRRLEDIEHLEPRQRRLEDIKRQEARQCQKAWQRQEAWQRRRQVWKICRRRERLRKERRRQKEANEAAQRLITAEEQRKKEEEISLNLQRLAPTVVHMSKKERDTFQQRILEAQSHKDIIQALNNIDPTKRQRQGQEHMQHQPSAQSPNPSRTSFVMSQSALPHHPTVPPEPEHKHAWDIEKREEVEHYQLQQGQQYQQENEEQHDLKRLGQRNQLEQGKRDLQRLGQNDQLEQGKRDLRRLGQKDQLEQRQQDQLNQGQQDANYKGCGIVVTLIWLFLLPPLVSAQCSTCLGGRCYDTGQCILGCVQGYKNQYCNEACPSNCLNNACELNTTSATITCTDGCQPGYCGTKCTRSCPEGCVRCDRQCGSCNMTLCPKRLYGEGCGSVCSPTYEKCDRETGECIKCRQGYYGDKCDRKCETCCSRGRNLMYKCLSGCDICKDQDSCPDGLFGANCELECSNKCGKSQETAAHPCNRATGECSAGCMPGYHGLNCNYTCSEHCLSGRCYRATGECSAGCMPGYHGLTCNYTCNGFCEGGLCNLHDGVCTSGCVSGYIMTSKSCEKLQDTGVKDEPVSNVLLIVLICVMSFVLIVFLVIFICARRSLRRRQESFETRNADKKERKSLTGVNNNHSDLQRWCFKAQEIM